MKLKKNKQIYLFIIIWIICIISIIIYLFYKNLNKQYINKQYINKQYINKQYINKQYKIYNIIIVTTKLIKSIAINISKFLQELNLNVIIQYDLSEEECINSTENELYIFINVMMIKHNKLPKLFILYQVEQSQSKWFNYKYYIYLNNANNIWDFSMKNRYLYNHINPDKIFYQMMPYYYTNIKNNDEIKYDIFFYGANNTRRQKILNCLSSFNIKIGFNVYDDERDDIISKSKIILNLHYYDDCALETCRINEILKYNKIIISEKPSPNDWYNQSLYADIVDFIDIIDNDLSNINNLIDKINYYLNDNNDNNNYNNNYNNKINQIKNNKIILHTKSKFNLYKNLFNIINFNNYLFDYDLTHNKIYCLHLIETPNRLIEFKKQNTLPDYEIFPAIKYNPGWKGCALSYVNLIYNAKRCNLNNITICEDDCRFPLDFYDKYNIIKNFLSKINWDIFVGVIADLPQDVELINIYEYKNIKFIELKKLHSMVFNIYNKSVYNKILDWKITIDNINNNQIDQYLKNQNLRIITTYPFYFDCINVDSTLWGKNLYTHYNNMFQKSLNILNEKIKKYKKNTIYIY